MKHSHNPLHLHQCQFSAEDHKRSNRRCRCSCGHRWYQSHRQKPKSAAPTRMKKWKRFTILRTGLINA